MPNASSAALTSASADSGSRDVALDGERLAAERLDRRRGLLRRRLVAAVAERDVGALAARRSAIARPIPREPPVTTALLPLRSIIRPSWMPRTGRASADRLAGVLRLAGHDVVERHVDAAGRP